MKPITTTLFAVIIATTLQAQTVNKTPDTTFRLSNNKSICLSGPRVSEFGTYAFTEFTLTICGESKEIDFWDATTTCRVTTNKDSLIVEELVNLPVGRKFSSETTVWTREALYFKNDKIERRLAVNRDIRKYNPDEINTVLKNYETAKPGISDYTMTIANQLFMATISGSKTARDYFKGFTKKFPGLDGAFKEEYNDLAAMLELWNKKK